MSNQNQLFVGYDLSGIQKFLYNISSKKAAVSLKGRSFYLTEYMHHLKDNVVNTLRNKYGVKSDVVYCSGGKMYLITESTKEVIDTLTTILQEERLHLWNEHFGLIGLNMGHVSFSENTDGSVKVEGEDKFVKPGILWQKVNEQFNHQKNRKFIDLITEQFNSFFSPISVNENTKVCAVTGIESPKCVEVSFEKNEEDEGDSFYVLPSVKEQIELGEKLRNKQHFKTFEEYAKNSKLGILRMDVDGLGKRFISGFPSIDAYRKFSGRLVEFFEKEVYALRENEEYKDYLNIIYAGGDDLFVVGRWDKVIDFAEKIHEETAKRFADEGITISGGVVVVNAKFPIAKAAELAGEAEDEAKNFKNNEKNAIHFLGRTVSWEKEFDYVKQYKDDFINLIKDFSLSKGILHKLMLYADIAEHNKTLQLQGKPLDYSYQWHIVYYLSRYKERYKSNKSIPFFCDKISSDISTNGRNLKLIALSARWAELILRDK